MVSIRGHTYLTQDETTLEVSVPLFFVQPDFDNMQAKVAVYNFQLAVIYNTNAMLPMAKLEQVSQEPA